MLVYHTNMSPKAILILHDKQTDELGNTVNPSRLKADFLADVALWKEQQHGHKS